MKPVRYISSGIFSPLGTNAAVNFAAIKNGVLAVKHHTGNKIAAQGFYGAVLSDDQLGLLAEYPQLSPLEAMCIHAVKDALQDIAIETAREDCIFVFSSTKGNIEWLGEKEDRYIHLHYSARVIAQYFGNPNNPVIISNACISGSLALITAKRLIDAGKYKHAIVIGCDRFSSFVLAGFQSFQAVAQAACRPFDRDRQGINLGEAAACIILSGEKVEGSRPLASLKGGGLSNDANHLSGPSRTGEELAMAIGDALSESGIPPGNIGAISAHGTATVYNDEMEAKALNLAGVAEAPLHSLKGYIGHTLGAAGIIESIVACMAMKEHYLPASPGFEHLGVSQPVNVMAAPRTAAYQYLLKTASGFGGCNAALIWEQVY